MSSVFISYRRDPSAMLARLIKDGLEKLGIDVYMDTLNVERAGRFPERLLEAISTQDVFVCLVADATFESEWVRREIEHAYDLNKPMIPVFQESYKEISSDSDVPYPTAYIEALLQHDGVHVLDKRNIYIEDAIRDLAEMIRNTGNSSLQAPKIEEKNNQPFAKVVKVPANREGGINTSVLLNPGDEITIIAAGVISFDGGNNWVSPDGFVSNPQTHNTIFFIEHGGPAKLYHPEAYKIQGNNGVLGSLFGWISEYSEQNAFLVGKNLRKEIKQPGYLHLAVNDAQGTYADNLGEFVVTIEVKKV
jgi:hypothetical protein